MTDTLENGIKLPAKGSRDWYSDASSNAHLIDEHLGDEDVHLTDDDRTAISSISSKADASDVYTKTQVDTALSSKADATNVYTKNEVDTSLSNKANSSDLTTHTSNTDVHVTTSDKTTWNAKQDALTDTQLSACNSGITSDKVAQYDGYATSKANDSSVVHTTGDETISGIKTFRDVVIGSDNLNIQGGGNWDAGARLTLNKKTESMSAILQTFSSTDSSAYIYDVANFYPYANNKSNLGTSTNKWKSFNGVNPGALSLPDKSTGINLDLTDFEIDGSMNKFKLTDFTDYPYDIAWMFVKMYGCTKYYADHWFKAVANTFEKPSTVSFFMPITDKYHVISLSCICTQIEYIKIFPCQGNV